MNEIQNRIYVEGFVSRIERKRVGIFKWAKVEDSPKWEPLDSTGNARIYIKGFGYCSSTQYFKSTDTAKTFIDNLIKGTIYTEYP